ncbi:MAG: Ribosomal RNA small subunit methyltransferase E [Alphaproteobacteria bacterium MarineAlpha4_Bin2]|nr:MAG: Ribosomal RNA small subunit methyltransferase E [Alphaproteobacteria bacterium MarineAlpha4_Bin2]
MAVGSARTRLYVEEDLKGASSVDLSRAQAHYLKHVLRMSTGDKVALFNGRDGEWICSVDTIGQGSISVKIEECFRGQADEPDLWLLFAPIKRTGLDFLVQKAVELGVSQFLPVKTERTEVRRLNLKRLRANVIEAAEQCERLTLPVFSGSLTLDDALSQFPSDRTLAVCTERGDVPAIDDVLRMPKAAALSWAILCGPEGGFTDRELDAFAKLPFIRLVSLGPRILRAETAALSAMTCWQAALGDWRRRPSERDLT